MPRYCISTGTDKFITVELINENCIEFAIGNNDRLHKISITMDQYIFLVESLFKQLETNQRSGDQER